MNPEVVNYMVGVEAAQDANYTFVEAIAKALDETVEKIEDWRKKAEEEGFDFVETSLQLGERIGSLRQLGPGRWIG